MLTHVVVDGSIKLCVKDTINCNIATSVVKNLGSIPSERILLHRYYKVVFPVI